MPAGDIVRRLVQGKSGWHSARNWRSALVTAIFCAVAGVVCIFLTLTVLASILLVGAVPIAFVAGYSFRQAVLDLGRLPWFHWLWLEDDPLLGGRPDDGEPPPTTP